MISTFRLDNTYQNELFFNAEPIHIIISKFSSILKDKKFWPKKSILTLPLKNFLRGGG